MKEKTLLRIALTIAILGVLGLYFISDKIVIEEKVIEKITYADIESDVKINGKISNIRDMEKIMIIEVMQPKEMPVLLFKDGDIDLEVGDDVYIVGSVEEFNGKLEIIADSVKKN